MKEEIKNSTNRERIHLFTQKYIMFNEYKYLYVFLHLLFPVRDFIICY